MKSFFFATVLICAAPVSAVAQGRPTDPAFGRMANAPQSGDGRWKGSLGFGMTISHGNSESTQASLSIDATRTMHDSRFLVHSLLIRATSGGSTTVDNDLAEGRYERNFGNASFG